MQARLYNMSACFSLAHHRSRLNIACCSSVARILPACAWTGPGAQLGEGGTMPRVCVYCQEQAGRAQTSSKADKLPQQRHSTEDLSKVQTDTIQQEGRNAMKGQPKCHDGTT